MKDVLVNYDTVVGYVVNTKYIKEKKSTICILTLTNGMEVIGFSQSQNPEYQKLLLGEDQYNTIGRETAYKDAISNAFPIVIAIEREKQKGQFDYSLDMYGSDILKLLNNADDYKREDIIRLVLEENEFQPRNILTNPETAKDIEQAIEKVRTYIGVLEECTLVIPKQ